MLIFLFYSLSTNLFLIQVNFLKATFTESRHDDRKRVHLRDSSNIHLIGSDQSANYEGGGELNLWFDFTHFVFKKKIIICINL